MDMEHISPLTAPDDPQPGDVVRIVPQLTIGDILASVDGEDWHDDIVALAGVEAEVVDIECAESGQPMWRVAGVGPALFGDELRIVRRS